MQLEVVCEIWILLNLSSVCMATLQEICYSCWSDDSDLSSKLKDRVIIRNKNDEYPRLYSIVSCRCAKQWETWNVTREAPQK